MKLVMLLLSILVSLGILLVFLPMYLVWTNMHPPRSDGRNPNPRKLGLRHERLDLVTSDGVHIVAWHLVAGPGAPVVFLVHGLGGSKAGMLEYATRLQRAGFHAVLMDLRGHGESGDGYCTFGPDEAKDVAVVFDAIRSRPDVDVGRFGFYAHSMGSSAAVLALARDPGLKGYVIDSGYDDLAVLIRDVGRRFYRIPGPITQLGCNAYHNITGRRPETVSPAAVLRDCPAPGLFFHAHDDRTIPFARGQALYEAAAGRKLLVEVPGDHLAATAECGYEDKLVVFFRRAFSLPDFDPATAGFSSDTAPNAKNRLQSGGHGV